MAPGGSVVACVSSDSPVASFPFRISRVCAPPAPVLAVSASNEKPPEGSELSCSPANTSGAAAPESAAAGNSKHISRRVIVIRASWFLVAPAFRGGLCRNFESTRAQKSLDSGPKNLLASLRLSSGKAQTKGETKTARSRSKQHAVQSLQYGRARHCEHSKFSRRSCVENSGTYRGRAA